MDAKHKQLESALEKQGWRVGERITENLSWWLDEMWIVRSEWSRKNGSLYLCFLVDPAWEGPRQPGQGIWAVSACASIPKTRREAEEHMLAMKGWAKSLDAFVASLDKDRGQSAQVKRRT